VNERDRIAMRIMRDALDADPAQRDRLVDSRCEDDPELRVRVMSLLVRALEIQHQSEREGHDEDATDNDADTLAGSLLGPFRVVERIGRGGMGVVYRGEREDADFTQTVALKLIRRGFDFDDVQARFLRERRILARLSHPGIARFIDGGVAADGRPWFALEFVHGEVITHWCDAHRLDIRARVGLFLEVCAAVQYAHTQLIVHRDLKPGNVLVDNSGAVRLLDFGIARLVGGDDEINATMTMAGASYALTPEYAAPEQFAGAAVGVGADVYALGVLLYELIAGVGPYPIDRNDMAGSERRVREMPPEALTSAIARAGNRGAGNANESIDDAQTRQASRLVLRHTNAHGYRASVRGDLSRIIEKALAKEPERRYATVDAFSGDLSRWLAGAPVQISGSRFGYRFGKFVKRNRVAVAIASTLAAGLVATSVFALHSAYNERLQREAAVAETARVNAVREYVMLMFRNAAEQRDSAKLTARDVLKQGADQIFTQFKDQPEIGQETALSLAELYMQLGDVNGGAPLLEYVIAWPGIENNPDVLAAARYNLAQVEYARGNAKRARTLLDGAQAWWNTQPVRYRTILNESRSTQAQLERAEGQVDKAIATLESTIVERRKTLGSNDREVGAALNALSLALAQAGRYEESAQRADESHALFEKMGAGSNVTGLAALNNRAVALMQLGQIDKATADFRRVVELRRQLYGRSPELASAQNNLALALVRQALKEDEQTRHEQLAEAVRLLKDSYDMAVEGSGEGGRSTAMARVNLAEAYAVSGDLAAAAPLAEAAIRIGRDQFGTDSPFAGLGYRARATVHFAEGHLEAAREDIASAKAIFGKMGKGGEAYLDSLVPLLKRLDVKKPVP
jgi:serine/threonine-protein kinase